MQSRVWLLIFSSIMIEVERSIPLENGELKKLLDLTWRMTDGLKSTSLFQTLEKLGS